MLDAKERENVDENFEDFLQELCCPGPTNLSRKCTWKAVSNIDLFLISLECMQMRILTAHEFSAFVQGLDRNDFDTRIKEPHHEVTFQGERAGQARKRGDNAEYPRGTDQQL